MHIYISDESVEFLSSQFPMARFSFFRSAPEKYISCFVCEINTSKELSSIWESVTSVIAADYQTALLSKFEAWNIYLVFSVSENICKTLKYEIENNKFSMRKLVVPATETNGNISAYLNNEILGADLTLKQIFSYIATPDVNGGGELQQKINELSEKYRSSSNSRKFEDMLELAEWVSNNEI